MHLGAYCFESQGRDIYPRWPFSKVLRKTVIWQLFTFPAVSHLQVSLKTGKDSDNIFPGCDKKKKKKSKEGTVVHCSSLYFTISMGKPCLKCCSLEGSKAD